MGKVYGGVQNTTVRTFFHNIRCFIRQKAALNRGLKGGLIRSCFWWFSYYRTEIPVKNMLFSHNSCWAARSNDALDDWDFFFIKSTLLIVQQDCSQGVTATLPDQIERVC
jgi:hypothetical protein